MSHLITDQQVTAQYLLFPTEQEGLQRAEAEARSQNLPFYRDPPEGKTRYLSTPKQTAGGEWALNVIQYVLTEEETSLLTTEVEFPQADES